MQKIQHDDNHRNRVELYPRRRETEYTHRPTPDNDSQSRRAEHPSTLNRPNHRQSTTNPQKPLVHIECMNPFTREALREPIVVHHGCRIVPPTNPTSRLARNAYFS